MHFYEGTLPPPLRLWRHKVFWPALHADASIDCLTVLTPTWRDAGAIKDLEGELGHPEIILGRDPIGLKALKDCLTFCRH